MQTFWCFTENTVSGTIRGSYIQQICKQIATRRRDDKHLTWKCHQETELHTVSFSGERFGDVQVESGPK